MLYAGMEKSDLWQIANQRARQALATIANKQMSSWERHPGIDDAEAIIARAIMGALEDAGVKGVE
jgi:hypothetical protein